MKKIFTFLIGFITLITILHCTETGPKKKANPMCGSQNHVMYLGLCELKETDHERFICKEKAKEIFCGERFYQNVPVA